MRKRIAGLQVMAKRRSSKSAPGHTCVGSEKKKRLYVWPSQPATGNPPSLIRSQHNRERKKTIYFTKETQHMEGGMGNRPLPSFVQPVPVLGSYCASVQCGEVVRESIASLLSVSSHAHSPFSHTLTLPRFSEPPSTFPFHSTLFQFIIGTNSFNSAKLIT